MSSPAVVTKGERTRQVLLDHAVQEICEVGVDKLSFTGVARRANLTTGSLYSRYEERSELLVDIWQSRCQSSLEILLGLTARSLAPDGGAARRELAAVLRDPTDDLLVAVELLLAARRLEEVAEVAVPWMLTALHDGTVGSQSDQFQYVAAIVIGILIMLMGRPSYRLDWSEYCDFSFSAWATSSPMKRVELPKVAITPTLSDDIDEFDARLIRATLDVVAKTGFERATVSRIARRSGVNPATLYQRFDDKEQLMRYVIDNAVVASTNSLTFANAGLPKETITDYQLVGMGLAEAILGPAFEKMRQLRIEIHLAAAHNTKVGAYIKEQAAKVFDGDVELMQATKSQDAQQLRQFAIAMRGFISGLSALNEIGVLDTSVPPALVPATHPSAIPGLITS